LGAPARTCRHSRFTEASNKVRHNSIKASQHKTMLRIAESEPEHTPRQTQYAGLGYPLQLAPAHSKCTVHLMMSDSKTGQP
jgi:hypothetical protein